MQYRLPFFAAQENFSTSYYYKDGKITRSNLSEIPADAISLKIPEEQINKERLNAKDFIFYLKLWPLLMEYFNNPLTSLKVSRTLLLPHQVEAALRVLESLNPRFLIADEVGLGKTIEAGLILKELILKYNYQKIIICVPATLLNQWQYELSTKFNEDFTIITGDILRKNLKKVYQTPKILISIDLAKEPAFRSIFSNLQFDIAIFDEAHRLRRDQSKITQAYAFAETIAKNSKVLLLLSATPFRGKIEEIFYLIQLLDPDLLGPLPEFLREFENPSGGKLRKKISPVVIRRRKKDVGGFTRRIARTVKLSLTPPERAFYDATTEYVIKEYNRAKALGQRTRSFVMITLQKLLDSSSFALQKALEKRRLLLEETLQNYWQNPSLKMLQVNDYFLKNYIEDDGESAEFLEDKDLEKDISINPHEIKQEIEAITRLLKLASKIEEESKFRMLLKTLRELKRSGHEKILIFTQFKNTLFFLQQKLLPYFKLEIFHGSLPAQEKDRAVEHFWDKNGVEILILTEAGGEGRNLQIATAMVNYDLPWSPLKIEQRIGRIHRFGQTQDVLIVNFATKDTVAERVLEILEKKIHIFEEALGESDILLGVLEDELNFSQNFSLLLSQKNKPEIPFPKNYQNAKKTIKKIEQLFSPEFLHYDISAIVDTSEKDNENETILEQVVSYFAKTQFQMIEKNPKIYEFIWQNQTHKGSFCRTQNCEYLAFGHPLVNEVVGEVLKTYRSGQIVEIFADMPPGYIFLLEVNFYTEKTHRRIYAVQKIKDKFSLLDSKTNFPIQTIRLSQDLWYKEEKILKELFDFLNPILEKEKQKILQKINPEAHFWQQVVTESYQKHSEILTEKLEIQKGKMKWYGEKNMSLAIHKTMKEQNRRINHTRHRLKELTENLRIKTEISLWQIGRIIPLRQ